jgi:hypothetical protein
MKLNTLGGWNWTRALGVDEPGKEDDLRDVRVDPATHDIYAAGFTNSSGAGNYDGWLLKLNPFGTLQWSRTYGRADEDLLLSLDMACNGRLVATGSTRSGTPGGDQDIYLVSVSPTNGALVWSKRRGGSGDEQGTSIVANNDPLTGGFYIAGQTTTGFAMPAEYVEKGECVSGNSVKQNTMSAPGLASVLSEIQVDSLGRPHVIGTTDQMTGSTKMHAMKLTAAGLGVVWSRIYGGGHSDKGFALVPTNDRNYTGDYWFTLFGTAGSFGPSPDLYAVGIDPNGVSGCFENDFGVSEHDPLFPTIKFIPQMADFLSDRGIAAVTTIHKENDPVCACGGERLRMQGGEILSDGTTPPRAGSPVAPSCR